MPTRMTKFCEGSWRFLFYSCSFVCGVGVLFNKPWLWNTGACWEQYPYHTVGWDIWLYYMLGTFDSNKTKYFRLRLFYLTK